MVIFSGDYPGRGRRQRPGPDRRPARHEHEPTVRFYDDQAHEKQSWPTSARWPRRHRPGARTCRHLGGLGGLRRPAGPAGRLPARPDALYQEFGYSGASLYGHFGQGCVHTRIPFDLVTADGIATFRRFIERAADLVVSYGGSFSGEHGDGQSRGELLPKMFGDDLVRAFGQFKAIFDPDDRMNPGKVVAPYPLDSTCDSASTDAAGLRPTSATPTTTAASTARCCAASASASAGGSERRGDVPVLHGHPGGGALHPGPGPAAVRDARRDTPTPRSPRGWRSAAVRDALDLCLACKGCKKDCPVNVDMATYKAEFLAHHYAGRLRPRSHYSMGWLPAVAQLASRAPGGQRAHPGPRPERRADRRGRASTGAARSRCSPTRRCSAGAPAATLAPPGSRGEVVLWPDTFTNHFPPPSGRRRSRCWRRPAGGYACRASRSAAA